MRYQYRYDLGMGKVNQLVTYADENGNTIDYPGLALGQNVAIFFKGRNNRIIAPAGTRIDYMSVNFDCDNGTLILGANAKVGGIKASIRIGQDATVKFGNNVNMTGPCYITAMEGRAVSFGDDVMIAQENEFRSDDAHPIFDVSTGKRLNVSQDVTIGNHVWFAKGAVALSGARIGDGSVVGFRSLVTGRIPNNCIAVGTPAKVVRRNIAWERPHLSLVPPFYKNNASSITRSAYWNLTELEVQTAPPRTLAQRIMDAASAFRG